VSSKKSGKPDIPALLAEVEQSPDDHSARWKLATAFYKTWEYRSAVEHLLILRQAWPDRPNVARMLAACYYRMGKYDDAIFELNTALAQFPDEVPLLETLARIYEGQRGRQGEALDVWKRVHALSPSETSQKAIDKLSAGPAVAAPAVESESASAFDTISSSDGAGVPCPHCGAPRELITTHCFRCHGRVEDAAPVAEAKPPRVGTAVWAALAVGLLIVGPALAGVYYWAHLR